VRSETFEAIEREVNALAVESQVEPVALLREVCMRLGEEAQQSWPIGGIPRLHEAPFLLAFVRQLAQQGWPIAKGLPLPCTEDERFELRSLWHLETFGSSPHRRELEEQRIDESADPVRVLSRLLARHAQEAWADAYATYAEIGFPLAHGSRSRVGRLRAYGNAIVAPAAQAFVEAVMECRP
jgi:hypothetical protein